MPGWAVPLRSVHVRLRQAAPRHVPDFRDPHPGSRPRRPLRVQHNGGERPHGVPPARRSRQAGGRRAGEPAKHPPRGCTATVLQCRRLRHRHSNHRRRLRRPVLPGDTPLGRHRHAARPEWVRHRRCPARADAARHARHQPALHRRDRPALPVARGGADRSDAGRAARRHSAAGTGLRARHRLVAARAGPRTPADLPVRLRDARPGRPDLPPGGARDLH